MRRLRVASVALLVVASTGLLLGSMGFSSVAADRGVSVAVADDDGALVGYDTHDQTVTGDERVELVTVQNQLTSSATVTNVDVDVAPDDGTVRVRDVSKPGTIPTGTNGTVDAAVDCEPGAAATLTVSVTVEADGVTAAISGDTATRSFEVTCADLAAHENEARFDGAGNFDFGEMDTETVNVTYWTASQQGGEWTVEEGSNTTEVDPSTKLNSQVDDGPWFVAVYVHESDTTYVHPGFDRANETVDWGQGNQAAIEVSGEYDPTDDDEG